MSATIGLDRLPRPITLLLVEQPDTELAIRGHDLIERAEDVERACLRLRARLHSSIAGP
jgi:hypothetical protein